MTNGSADEGRCPNCGAPSASYPAEVYCVECATTDRSDVRSDTRRWELMGDPLGRLIVVGGTDPTGLDPGQTLWVVPEAEVEAVAMKVRSDAERDYALARALIGKAETNGAFADDADPHALRDAVKRLHGQLAEVGRLREALELIAGQGTHGPSWRHWRTIAREALASDITAPPS